MHYRKQNADVRGRRARERCGNGIKLRRLIREDMWAYGVIASSIIEPSSATVEASSYYLNPKRLLQICYPSCYQSWERFQNVYGGYGHAFSSPAAPMYTERPPECEVSNRHDPPDDKSNLIFLATVAGMDKNHHGHPEFHFPEYKPSSENLAECRDFYLPYDNNEDSKETLKMFKNVIIKSENDSSTYLSI